MFNFLKKKLKGVIDTFSSKVDEEAKEEIKETPKIETPVKKEVKEKIEQKKKETKEKKPTVKKKETKKTETEKIETKKEEQEEKIQETKEEPVQEVKAEVTEEKQEIEETIKPAEIQKEPEKQGFFSKLFKKKEPIVEPTAEQKQEIKIEQPKEKLTPEKPAEGFFGKLTQAITTKKLSEQQYEELFWDLEIAMLENNVALEVIQKIKNDLKANLVDKPIPRGQVQETITSTLKTSITELFDVPTFDLIEKIKTKKPYVICFVGINGSGKTTTIAKIAHKLKENGLSVVLAAADTFRAAAIDQLQLHADKINVKIIKHDYGSDPAAVAFDAIKHAEATNKDVVLIDTAGRLHSNINLMDEVKKIIRIAKPDIKLFIGESITGNDCTEQAQSFNNAIGIDGIILSKADIDEKGGAAISVSFVTGKPILYLGTGQEYDDIQEFDKEKLIDSLGI